VKKRLINEQTLSYLRQLLGKEEWEEVRGENDPDLSLVNFTTTLQYYYDLACPLKWRKVKQRETEENWISSKLKQTRELVIFLTEWIKQNNNVKISDEQLARLKSSYIVFRTLASTGNCMRIN
jgi:hypothetical protein